MSTTASTAAHATADALGILRDMQSVFTVAATHCACCGKDLRDSVSVTRGMGPDCSREHYEIAFEITEDMVDEAIGRLAASKLDSRIKAAVAKLRTKPRDLCNVLVWWSAVNLNNADVVLECAEVVSLLGFTSLGDRLRERNTNVVITKTADGDFILRCRSKAGVIRHMRSVREAVQVEREGRFKYGWRFPDSRKDLVWTILGEDFGGQWATVPGKGGGPTQVVRIPVQTYWHIVRAIQATYNPPAPVSHTVVTPVAPPVGVVRVTSTGIEVHTPNLNWKFVGDLKLLPNADRRWDGAARCWRVAPKHEQKVRELVATHFPGAT